MKYELFCDKSRRKYDIVFSTLTPANTAFRNQRQQRKRKGADGEMMSSCQAPISKKSLETIGEINEHHKSRR